MSILKFFEDLYKKIFVKKKPAKDFSSLKHVPAIGDCILIQTDSLVADGIEWFSGGKVSHVALYVGGGKGKIIEALIEGVKVKTLDKYFKPEYTVYVRRIKNLKVNQAEIMKDWAYAQVDKPYDIKQFLSLSWYFILHKTGLDDILRAVGIEAHSSVMDDKDKLICSELYNQCAIQAGIKLTKKKDKVVTPQNLLETTKMETIAEV